uniref:Uncharacterized protein n=1 Tax=Rhizophora mucronata TaxID=61149 RepID=A0A2P2K8G5_RHIMU
MSPPLPALLWLRRAVLYDADCRRLNVYEKVLLASGKG